MLIDSIRTDNQQFGISGRLMAGRYMDPIFGEVSATSFMQLRPSNTDTIPDNSVYDSIILELQLDYYSYGASG